MSANNQSTPCMNFMEYESLIVRFQSLWRSHNSRAEQRFNKLRARVLATLHSNIAVAQAHKAAYSAHQAVCGVEDKLKLYARMARARSALILFQSLWRKRRDVWGFYSKYAGRARLEARMASSIAHKA